MSRLIFFFAAFQPNNCFLSFFSSIYIYDFICRVFFKTENQVKFPPTDISQISSKKHYFFYSLLCLLFSPVKRFAEFCKCSLRCNFKISTYFKSFVSNKELIASREFVLIIKLYLAEFFLFMFTIKLHGPSHNGISLCRTI